MRLDDLRESSNVEDRRGRGGGMLIGGGGLGAVVIVILALVFGVDPRELLGDGGAPSAPQQAGAPPDRSNPDLVLSAKVLGATEDVWSKVFEQNGATYRPTKFVVYQGGTQTGCGVGQAAMGPFYCPSDEQIYLDLAFFNELSTRFGAPGDFAKAYVIAHEVGHHVQKLTGVSDKAQAAMARGGGRGADGVAVRVELQADCYAGVWARQADAQFHMLEAGDIDEGLAAAYAVGDDTLQRATRGTVAPDSFTHGSSAQRVRWFKRGAERGDPSACDTFGAERL